MFRNIETVNNGGSHIMFKPRGKDSDNHILAARHFNGLFVTVHTPFKRAIIPAAYRDRTLSNIGLDFPHACRFGRI